MHRKITSLCFQGGSVKGTAYLGALEELQKHLSIEKDIKRVGGTSAGAITAMLLSFGCSLDKIKKLLLSIDFKEFLDEDKSILPTRSTLLKANNNSNNSRLFGATTLAPITPILFARSVSDRGIYDGERILNFFQIIAKEATNTDDITFEELHGLTLVDPKFKDLFVVAYNVDTAIAQTFSYIDTPTAVVTDAVRASISIPLLFKPHYRYNKDVDGKRIADPDNHIFIDGGITDNYPVNLFDRAHFQNDNLKEQKESHVFNTETLGFRLVNRAEKDFLEGKADAPLQKNDTFLQYATNILKVLLKKQYNDHVRGLDKERTIYIDVIGVGTLQFDLTDEVKAKLIESGKKATEEYFAGKFYSLDTKENQLSFLRCSIM